MPSRHLSLRLESSTFDQLANQSRQMGQSRSQLAKTLLEEGLRMESQPGIVFRSGRAGRRPGVAGGPDVWEVVRVFTGIGISGESAVRQTAEMTGLGHEQVRTALRYYADFREEIDRWIERIDVEAARAEAQQAAGIAECHQLRTQEVRPMLKVHKPFLMSSEIQSTHSACISRFKCGGFVVYHASLA